MQLILSIDDIGIKNNMSAGDEIIQNEKEVKNPLLDNILSYSKSNIIDDNRGKQDKIVQDSHNSDIVRSSNGTITNDDASEVLDGSEEDSKISVCKTANVENGSDIQQSINKEVDLTKNAPKNIKTEYEKDAVSVDECKEKQISPNGTSEINCEKINNTDMKASVKSETKDIDESHLENRDVIQTKDGNESLIQATDVIQNEKQTVDLNHSLEEKQSMEIYQDELEDFDADVIENDIPENSVIGSLENTDDNQQSDRDIIKDVIENAIQENAVIDSLENTDDNQQSDRDIIKDVIENAIPENAVIDSFESSDDNQQSDRDNIKDVIENAIPENEIIDSLEPTDDNQQSDRDNIKDLIENDIPENAVIDSLETTDDNQQSDRNNTKDVIQNPNPENAVIDSLETTDDNQQGDRDNNNENGPPTGSISDEIIDIADDKDSCDSTDDKGQFENNFVENIPLDIDSSDESTETQIILKTNTENFEKSSPINILDKTVETSTLDKIIRCSPVVLENIPNKENITEIKENSSTHVANVEPANKIMKFRLSNNLDILSDDEDSNTNKPESPKSELEPEPSIKQCINIEDDDDIMLIDDETTTKENKTIRNDVEDLNIDSKDITNVIDQVENKQDIKEDTIQTVQCKHTGLEEATIINEEQKEIDIPEKKDIQEKSPLLSPTFLKSFKKNLSDMTREELEDFCILKIVESVIDKSSLGEIKSQLKVVAEKIDDYKGRANVLAKQNRDLQLVLKSVQEELKKDPGAAINPLKITRSVGMQITLNDKSLRKRQCTLSSQTHQNANINNQNTTSTNNKNQVKSQVMQSARTTKPQQQQQQIPVPRLIPAVNTGTKSGPNPSPQAINNISKSPTLNNIPNGMKNPSPAAKPEKRTHSKMQQMYVDLTDDEPPAKNLNTRVFNSSVRCVPPQALLAPQRAPLSQNISSPKKVYIPISGPQSQNIRPGQHIVLKSVSSQVSRPRGPSPNTKTHPSIKNARFGQRHPAPLPDVMKQYQPPNWKPLPPPPELKLAKVENGLVISWKITGFIEENHEEIASYQLYAYQETSIPPSTSLWKKIGDVKALPLPMACTLTQFISGYKYYFAVRAVDIRSRYGNFSLPGSILLGNNP